MKMDVIFNPENFRAIYKGFESISNEKLLHCFEIASTIVGNGNSCVPYNPEAVPPVLTRETVLNLVTCHIATMAYLWDVTQNGAVASAAQGSVNVSFNNANSPEWWGQTKCGATAWMILKRYKTGLIYYGLKTIPVGG